MLRRTQLLLTLPVTYRWTVYPTDAVAFIKDARAEVLIDNSFWLRCHNDKQSGGSAAGFILFRLRRSRFIRQKKRAAHADG